MLTGLLRLILFRFFGARVLLAITALGWLRRALGRRRDRQPAATTGPVRRT